MYKASHLLPSKQRGLRLGNLPRRLRVPTYGAAAISAAISARAGAPGADVCVCIFQGSMHELFQVKGLELAPQGDHLLARRDLKKRNKEGLYR